MNFLTAGPLVLVNCILLVFAIARITHKRNEELRDPTLGSLLAALSAVAVSVSTITFAVASILTFLAIVAFQVLGHHQGPGAFILFYLVWLQAAVFAGIAVGFIAGPSFSRFIWAGPPDNSDQN